MVNEFTVFTVYYILQPEGSKQMEVFSDREDLSDDDILELAYQAGLPRDAIIVGIAPWIE